MAKIKMSSIGITNLSGKAGGSVYSRNRGGAYFKNFVMPSNTITEARQIVRGIFGSIASSWRALSESARSSWSEQASNYPTKDVFGDTVVLAPNALYGSLNGNLLNAGLPAISVALPPQGTNGILGASNFDLNVTNGDIELAFDTESDNATAGNTYVLEATPPIPNSISNVSNKYRSFRSTTMPDVTPFLGTSLESDNFAETRFILYDLYVAKFGTPSVGNTVYFRVKAINPTTGEVSAYWYSSQKVVA